MDRLDCCGLITEFGYQHDSSTCRDSSWDGEHGPALIVGKVYLVDFAIHIYTVPGSLDTVLNLG